MGNRLWSDLSPSNGRRFWSAQTSSPGFISPAPAVLTLLGRDPAAAQNLTVFRTPATATLTLNGMSVGSPTVLTPAIAALSIAGLAPSEQLIRIISPALAPTVENPPPAFTPTLITIWTTQPGVAQLTIQSLEQNVTQGGNIGFVSPGVAQLSFGTLPYTLISEFVGLGGITIQGLAPTVLPALTISPDPALLTCSQTGPDLALPFTWVDDDPAPSRTWITDAAA